MLMLGYFYFMEVKSKKKIKFQVQLNLEQKGVKDTILHNQVVVLTGKAGTGKTLVTAATALDLLFRKEVEKIYITRPMVTVGKSIGFLPGTMEEKSDPFILAIKYAMFDAYAGADRSKKEKIEKHFKEGDIEILPIQYIRGLNIDNSILIVTESQNTNAHEMEAILTRLGKNGRIVIEGDVRQSDVKNKDNGLSFAIELTDNIEEIKYCNLFENHRSGIVKKILDYVERK